MLWFPVRLLFGPERRRLLLGGSKDYFGGLWRLLIFLWQCHLLIRLSASSCNTLLRRWNSRSPYGLPIDVKFSQGFTEFKLLCRPESLSKYYFFVNIYKVSPLGIISRKFSVCDL